MVRHDPGSDTLFTGRLALVKTYSFLPIPRNTPARVGSSRSNGSVHKRKSPYLTQHLIKHLAYFTICPAMSYNRRRAATRTTKPVSQSRQGRQSAIDQFAQFEKRHQVRQYHQPTMRGQFQLAIFEMVGWNFHKPCILSSIN